MEVLSPPRTPTTLNWDWTGGEAVANQRQLADATGFGRVPGESHTWWGALRRSINIYPLNMQRPWGADIKLVKFQPQPGNAVQTSVRLNVSFPDQPLNTLRNNVRHKIYRQSVILDYRDVGGNALWTRWYGGGFEDPITSGITFWRNGQFNPNWFRVDIQWPTIPSRGRYSTLPPLPNYNVPANLFPRPYGMTPGYRHQDLGTAGAEVQHRINAFGKGRWTGQDRRAPRMFYGDTYIHEWWWHHLTRPGGSVIRIDMEMGYQLGMCLATIRVFGHAAGWSLET